MFSSNRPSVSRISMLRPPRCTGASWIDNVRTIVPRPAFMACAGTLVAALPDPSSNSEIPERMASAICSAGGGTTTGRWVS